MLYLRSEARLIARNPGAWMALTGLVTLAAWPFGMTLRILYWMDNWGVIPGLALRIAWTAVGLAWVRSRQAERAGDATSSTAISAHLAVDAASIQLVPQLAASHDAACATLRARLETRCGGGQGEPYTVAKSGLLSVSGASVPRGDPRARAATAYLHRTTSGPRYLIARVDVATGEYSEQPVDEMHWNLLAG